MTRLNGGTAVKGGYYWNAARWEIVTIPGEAGRLPEGEKFLAIPTPLLFVVAPLMGALYAFFLPFIGFAMAAAAIGARLGLVGTAAAKEIAATMGPSWRPGEAHFAERHTEEKGEERQLDALDKLQKQIDAMRAARKK